MQYNRRFVRIGLNVPLGCDGGADSGRVVGVLYSDGYHTLDGWLHAVERERGGVWDGMGGEKEVGECEVR